MECKEFDGASSLMTVLRKLLKYGLELVGVQEIKWEGGGNEPIREYTFFWRNWNGNHKLVTSFLVHS
jgi:hypothetical protein